MLLLVIEPQLDHSGKDRRQAHSGRLDEQAHCSVNGRAVGVDFVQAGPRDQATFGTEDPAADGIVIGIEQIPK